MTESVYTLCFSLVFMSFCVVYLLSRAKMSSTHILKNPLVAFSVINESNLCLELHCCEFSEKYIFRSCFAKCDNVSFILGSPGLFFICHLICIG